MYSETEKMELDFEISVLNHSYINLKASCLHLQEIAFIKADEFKQEVDETLAYQVVCNNNEYLSKPSKIKQLTALVTKERTNIEWKLLEMVSSIDRILLHTDNMILLGLLCAHIASSNKCSPYFHTTKESLNFCPICSLKFRNVFHVHLETCKDCISTMITKRLSIPTMKKEYKILYSIERDEYECTAKNIPKNEEIIKFISSVCLHMGKTLRKIIAKQKK